MAGPLPKKKPKDDLTAREWDIRKTRQAEKKALKRSGRTS